MKQRGFRYCRVCKTKLQKWGKTGAGKQRWRCPVCSLTATKPRPDLRRVFVFEGFMSWLLGKDSQDDLAAASRTFRDQTAWCWGVPVPSVLTGECHHCVIVDGICVGGHVCLIARTTMFVIAWMWVPYESSTYWATFLASLPAPTYVVCDGQKGLLKALPLCWPGTIVQRCRFHIWLNVKTKLTLHPESIAGKELLVLTKNLLHVRTRKHARHWKQRLRRWYKRHQNYVNERTVKPYPKPRERSWRYTHERLRSAYRQLDKVTDDALRSSYRPHAELPSTTNHVEGGINSQIRTKLKYHRGMSREHQRVLVNWYLYTRSEGRKPTRFCL